MGSPFLTQIPMTLLQFFFRYLTDVQNLLLIFIHLLNEFSSSEMVPYSGAAFRTLFYISLGVEFLCFYLFAFKRYNQHSGLSTQHYTVVHFLI